MTIIEPDFDRLIDLPGAGPTPRPVEIDGRAIGFHDLLSLHIDELADGAVIEGAAEEEVVLVLLAGAIAVDVIHPSAMTVLLDADGDWGLHLPPGSAWRLRPQTPATLAQAAARPGVPFAPKALRPTDGSLLLDGPNGNLRLHLHPLDDAAYVTSDLDEGLERFLHFSGPARVAGRELPPMHTLALHPGERTQATGDGEVLALAAIRRS